jgi:hypothetical protein
MKDSPSQLVSPHSNSQTHTTKGTIIVEPDLRVNERACPLESLCIQTVLPVSLGPIKDWHTSLRATSEAGYNMVHLTPIQVCE